MSKSSQSGQHPAVRGLHADMEEAKRKAGAALDGAARRLRPPPIPREDPPEAPPDRAPSKP